MNRRIRYKRIKFWRKFRDSINSINDESQLKNILFKLREVTSIDVKHGWTTWVTVIADGTKFIERDFWAHNSLKIIGNKIYQQQINKLFNTY